ncbi:ribonucleotide-diphosphate reductase subunit beta [Candidatus Peregrinibacteria bacterium]|nr:MAG: ribonucleotide-diphosphate reductase subunit beta [Candidatus Peregrinibacteria bacterium]
MSQKQIVFDPNAESTAKRINLRRVINGEDDGLMQVSPLKHPWAQEVFKTMQMNNWMPEEVPMGEDVQQWRQDGFLTENERRVYKRALAFVSNLDGIQTENLTTNVVRQITSPEVKLALVRQAYEEALHVHSYATMVEALGFDPDEIYGMYKKDLELYEKNRYVLSSFAKISENNFHTGTPETDADFLESCMANIVLEGIYFYSAFLVFYVLRRNQKMPGSAQMIQFINRDEDMHLRLFTHIFNTIREEQPEIWTKEMQDRCTKIVLGAYEHELDWGKSCIHEGILGLTPENLEQYLQFVADMRLRQTGLPKQFHAENPFPWIDEITQNSMIETNFFEGTVREYSTGALEW